MDIIYSIILLLYMYVSDDIKDITGTCNQFS